MIIDCDTCEVRGLACDDCVVSVLLGQPRPELDASEQAAIGVLAESGLVPPLRLVRATDHDVGPRGGEEAPDEGDDRDAGGGERGGRTRPAAAG